MTDLDTQLQAKQPEHDEHERLMAEFKARGGQVEIVPRGAMAETGWTARQRVNPSVETKAIRQAEQEAAREGRRAEVQATPIARDLIEPRQKRKPKPAKEGPRTRFTETAKQILALLPDHPTVPQLAKVTGRDGKRVWDTLNTLREKGLVTRTGGARVMARWELTGPASQPGED